MFTVRDPLALGFVGLRASGDGLGNH